MIRNPRDKELPTKQESGNNDDNPPASSRLWQGLKNPRIVRVSKLFGGKDRHSKVSTIRGLRDRRVRLSVPTAIQLYDLQDKLGLSQPSKAVDWLLNAAQHKIDKLPPLPIPLGNYVQLPQSSASFQVAQSQASSNPSTFETSKYSSGIGCSLDLSYGEANDEMYSNDAGVADLGILPKSTDWNLDVPPGNKQKDAARELSIAKGNIAEVDQVGDRGVDIHGVQTFARGPLLRVGNFSVSGLPNKSMPYASYQQWDPSNTNKSHSESHSTEAERHNFSNSTLISSSMSVTPGSQLVYYSSGAGTSMIPSYMAASAELDRRQFEHLHMTTSASQDLLLNSLRTHQLDKTTTRFLQSNLAPKQHHSQNPRGS